MKHIFFTPGDWENTGLVYAYSWRFKELPTFKQESECIVNSPTTDPPQLYAYDYMGLLTSEACGIGSKCSVHCSFEGYGAPMLVISDRNEIDENGIFRTLDYYELVMWKNGLNVWRMHTEGRQVSWYNVLKASFPVTENEIHTLSVKTQQNRLLLQVDDQELELFIHDLPDSFHMGYTACEGICRLYDIMFEE